MDNFQGKGRKNDQNNTETKQNEKKRKGFEKKLRLAMPKEQGPFSKQREKTWTCQREEKQEWKNKENIKGIKREW